MAETLRFGDLAFEVRRSLRRRTLGLTVGRAGELRVHAPESITDEDLQRWVKGKLDWVYQKLALKSQVLRGSRSPEYVSGEAFSYLGRCYRLKVSDEQDIPLRFDGKHFHLRSNARSDAAAHFRRWYINSGSEWLTSRVESLARKTGSASFRIEVRDLGYRWGSCGKKRVLYFNWKLLQLPTRLADYVIAHEIMHLQVPHHGPAFWHALGQVMPDCRQRHDELRVKAAEFMTFGIRSSG